MATILFWVGVVCAGFNVLGGFLFRKATPSAWNLAPFYFFAAALLAVILKLDERSDALTKSILSLAQSSAAAVQSCF